jgi:C-terminal processing protease CtpA/Prc
MNSAQLFEVMSNMLAELQDGHVNLYYSADMSRYWSWHEDYPRNFDEDLRDRYLGKDYKIAAGLKYRILDDNTGYVVYESFSSGIGDGNIDEVLYYLRSCNGLILDIRGNGGGMLTNAERLTAHFTNQRTLVGYTMHKTGPGHNDFSTPQPEYINPSTGIRWQKPVVLLTNRECYSSANVFVRNMKCLDNVTILGDRTGGGGGLPFTSELPCGWAVRFSACPTMDAQMQHTEFGVEPHIHCALDSADQAKGIDTLIEKARTLLK